jgi:UMF1 family MFS transporter
MYDWANSAYATTVLAGLLPVYFAAAVVGDQGVDLLGSHFSATSLWSFAGATAALLAFLAAPFLGAVADFSASKRRFLLGFAYTGSLFATLLIFCRSGDAVLTLVFFIIAQVSFVSANVFYDAFLPQIASPDRLDRVSGRGYAYGYIGGGLQFAVALGLVAGHQRLGLSEATAARIGLGMAGLWWAGFTLITARYLREARSAEVLPKRYARWPRVPAYLAVGVGRTVATARRVGRFRHLLLFLVAFMLYNDGIQTVIFMSTMFGKEELGLSATVLMVTLLLVQLVAMAGALVFSRLADLLGTKAAIMVTLVLWSSVVIYAYFIHSAAEFLLLGAVVGLILGGSQALSRSYYSSMIPPEASAEFFGFYTVFSKFSAIGGPLIFGIIHQLTGSGRKSIVALMGFFLVGLVLLWFVDEKSARRARDEGAF